MKSKSDEEGRTPPNIKTQKETNTKWHIDEWDINANTTYKNTHSDKGEITRPGGKNIQ